MACKGPLAAALLACALAAPALAVNNLFLSNSPLGRMTSQDVDIFYAAVAQVLNDGADGVPATWENSRTGARGTLTPLATYPGPTGPCRDLRVQNSVRGINGNTVVSMCKTADGDWRMRID